MRTTRTRRTAGAATAALLGLASLTGFRAGGDDPFSGKSADEVAELSLAASRSATSLTVKGTALAKGKSVRIDMQVSKSGDCKGTTTVKGEGSFALIRNSKHVFIKADEAFIRAQLTDLPKEEAEATAETMAGHWMRSKAQGELSKDLSALLCDLDELLSGTSDVEGAKKGKLVEQGGQEALTVSVPHDDGHQVLYVATHGTPYILRLVQTGAESGDVSFSDFNKPVNAKDPAGKVLDFGL